MAVLESDPPFEHRAQEFLGVRGAYEITRHICSTFESIFKARGADSAQDYFRRVYSGASVLHGDAVDHQTQSFSVCVLRLRRLVHNLSLLKGIVLSNPKRFIEVFQRNRLPFQVDRMSHQ